MIDYLNPSRISANPPTETEPFCVEICTTNCKKTSLRGEKVRKSAEIIQGRQTMADMSNEQAARTIYGVFEMAKLKGVPICKDFADARDMAIAALRGWVKTADRLPTEADAGYGNDVVAIYRKGKTESLGCNSWVFVASYPQFFPYWMPLPSLPEAEG